MAERVAPRAPKRPILRKSQASSNPQRRARSDAPYRGPAGRSGWKPAFFIADSISGFFMNVFHTQPLRAFSAINTVMAENARNGWVWKTFMKNPEIESAMKKAGFQPDRPAGPR